jgi:hypothetical protein
MSSRDDGRRPDAEDTVRDFWAHDRSALALTTTSAAAVSESSRQSR